MHFSRDKTSKETTTKRRRIEFEALSARAHKAGLKLIIDIVPNYIVRENKEKKVRKEWRTLGQMMMKRRLIKDIITFVIFQTVILKYQKHLNL
jgi:hypothetical protein